MEMLEAMVLGGATAVQVNSLEFQITGESGGSGGSSSGGGSTGGTGNDEEDELSDEELHAAMTEVTTWLLGTIFTSIGEDDGVEYDLQNLLYEAILRGARELRHISGDEVDGVSEQGIPYGIKGASFRSQPLRPPQVVGNLPPGGQWPILKSCIWG